MKRNLFKRGMAGLLSLVMCLTALVGLGTTTAFAAGEQAEVYLISFPRSGDANLDYGGSWGHPNLQYMNGWYSGNSKYGDKLITLSTCEYSRNNSRLVVVAKRIVEGGDADAAQTYAEASAECQRPD